MKRHFAPCALAAFVILILFAVGSAPLCEASAIGETAVKEAVKKHIEDNATWPKDRIRVEFLGSMPRVDIPAGDANLQVRSRAGEHYIGRTSFAVRFCKGDTFLREETIRVRIEVLTDVVASTHGIPRDHIIGPGDVTVTSKWMDTATTGVLTDAGEAVGKKAAVRLNAGTEITRQMLRSVPVVKKGEVVRIVLESGPMMISTVGLCQEDGGRGDLVRVQNLSSKKIIFARVMAQSLVKVEF
jgi:flagella basal body P-ring formation protein FlgA